MEDSELVVSTTPVVVILKKEKLQMEEKEIDTRLYHRRVFGEAYRRYYTSFDDKAANITDT